MNSLFAARNVLFYCFVVMMLLKHIIGMNGTFPDISINCKTYVVGYPCAIKCHVPDFKHEIVIFGPQNTRVGRCSSDRLCSVVHNGFELKRNLIMKSIILKISELNKNHVGNWYCVYGGGRTSNVVQLQKVKDLPTERTTSRYLEVNEGESITLHCDFDFCTDCYVIKWYKDGIELQGKDPSYQMEFQNLTITKITQEDKGVYMCSVTESGFTIRNGPYIVIYSVRKKPLAYSSQYLSAFEGQSLTLICDLVTNELVTVASWKLDGIDVDDKMKYRITNNGEKLIIKDLNEIDKGTYVCFGTTDRGTQLQGPYINLYSIASIPKRDLPTERSTSRYLEVNEGESITLHCDFDFCTDCYVIKWYKDGIELQGKDPSYQVEFQSLTITKITQEDKGVYMCSVTESGFTIRNGSYIVIYSVRKKSLAHSSQYLSAFEGQPLTLICDLVTNELVTVASWKLDGIDLDNKMKYKITYNGDNLIINDLNKNDKGTYVCYGTTDRGTQLHGPNINLYSIASIPKRDPQSLTENPSPTRNTYADTSQGYAQINPFWNISVWLLVLMFKFGFWLIYLWIFGPVEYCNITKSLFSDASFLILLQRWIIVLGPALILISTPTTITVFEDVSVFSSPTVLFIVTVIFCRAVKRDKLIDPRIAEEQRRLCN